MARKKRKKRAFLLTMRASYDGSRWTCTCLEFGVSSFGKDLGAVEKEVLEMTSDQIETLAELGDLENYIERHRVPVFEIDGGQIPASRRIQVPVEAEPDTTVFSSVRMLQTA
ncbi:hypothetical protein HY256_10395 [Candidatus Sumerlaeota bacterium]|nr:hypothetical protein [Candidatus Sumerlaeota bacterium]